VRALRRGGLPWKNLGSRDLFCNLHFSNKVSLVVIPSKAFRGLCYEHQAPPLGPIT